MSNLHFIKGEIRHFVCVVITCLSLQINESLCASIKCSLKKILKLSLNNRQVELLGAFLLGSLKVDLYCLCRSMEVIVQEGNCCRRCRWFFNLGIKWQTEIRQWADVSCQRDCSSVWCYHFLVACYHLSAGSYHPQRSMGTMNPVLCTSAEAYENNHAPCP